VLAAAVDEAIREIEQEITNLRAIITELRPAALDQLGLAPALESLFERHRTIHDLTITEELDVPTGAAALEPDLQATVYRVVQEALTNVAKHAGAATVRVVVHVEGERLVVQIADDGRGFESGPRSSGFGLTGMRERVAVAGGRLTVDSSPSGTTVTAELPRTPPRPKRLPSLRG